MEQLPSLDEPLQHLFMTYDIFYQASEEMTVPFLTLNEAPA